MSTFISTTKFGPLFEFDNDKMRLKRSDCDKMMGLMMVMMNERKVKVKQSTMTKNSINQFQ